jgi:hypothetical protein
VCFFVCVRVLICIIKVKTNSICRVLSSSFFYCHSCLLELSKKKKEDEFGICEFLPFL